MGARGAGDDAGDPGATDLSDLAFARFTFVPALTREDFVHQEVAPRFGGDAAATRYLVTLALLDGEVQISSGGLRRLRVETVDAARQTGDEASRRRIWLADRVSRREKNAR